MSVNGACGSKHMQCTRGTAIDTPEDDVLYYRWTCVGVSNGIPEQCREAKDLLVSKSNPPAMVRECHKSFMGWWDWCSVIATAQYVYSIFLAIFGSVATLVIIYGGILYITSGGDSQKTERAKKVITYALIGIVIVTATYGLISLSASLIGSV